MYIGSMAGSGKAQPVESGLRGGLPNTATSLDSLRVTSYTISSSPPHPAAPPPPPTPPSGLKRTATELHQILPTTPSKRRRQMPEKREEPGRQCAAKQRVEEGCVHVNNSGAVVNGLTQLFNNPLYSDVTVRVDYQCFHLHKLLLLRSDVFRVMLTGSRWADSKKPEIQLEEIPECIAHMESFFRYFYTGEVLLNRENLAALMILANKYAVLDLEMACERHACSLVFAGTDIATLVDWWQLADQLRMTRLYTKVRDYLALNMNALLAHTDNYLSLSLDQWKSLLQQSDMVVSGEMALFSATLLWLEQDKHNYVSNLEAIASLIKFSQMSPEDLINIENTICGNREALGVLNKYILDAFKYNAVSFSKRHTMGLSKHDCPRLYVGSASSPSPICSTIHLQPCERVKLAAGMSQMLTFPVSMASVDRTSTKEWCCSFREMDGAINLEIATVMESQEDFNMVEASFLIYRQMNNVTFVKGVMQLRGFVKMQPPSPGGEAPGRAGHIFTIVLPKDTLDPHSSYQIKDGDVSHCQFRLVMRHYHQGQVTGSDHQKRHGQHTEVISNPVPTLRRQHTH